MFNSKLNLIIKRIIKFVWNSDITELLKQTLSVIALLLKNNGTLYTVKYLKTCRLVITRYMCGKPLYRVKEFISIKNGFPKRFYFMKSFIDSRDNISIRIILTLLSISRTIKPTRKEEIPISYDTITAPYKGRNYTIPSWFIKKYIATYTNKKVLPPVTKSDFYLSLKQGPHGPTILSLVNTIKYYQHINIFNLWYLGGQDFVNKIFGPFFSYINHNEFVIPKGPSRKKEKSFNHKALGRIAIVKDPECKMRPIAMIDYYSQVVLKPISMTIFDTISKIPCDRTFTQNPFHNWEGDDNFWSLDLTAATDRIPINLQQKLLSYYYVNGFRIGERWKSILVDRDYITPNGELLRYAVGQPMGCYSSWAMLAFTHHLIVAWSAHLCGKDNFLNYILLGDDIVIKDNKVAKKYIQVMTKLGVDISPHKTHVSKLTYEFAKRWIRDGKEISGLPLRGIFDNLKNPLILYLILLDYFTIKGNTYLGATPLYTVVWKVYDRLQIRIKDKIKSWNPRFLKTNLSYFSTTVRHSLGLATNEELRELLAQHSAHLGELALSPDITILWKRVISSELVELVKVSTTGILKSGDMVWKYLTILVPDLNQISTFPFLIALSNYLERTISACQNYLNNFDKSEDQIDLISVVKEISFLDFNKVATWDRNWFPAAMLTTKVIKRSLRSLSLTESVEEYYMDSGMISDQSEKVQNIKFNSEQTLKRITPILNKEYKNLPPQAVQMIKQMSKRHGGAFWL